MMANRYVCMFPPVAVWSVTTPGILVKMRNKCNSGARPFSPAAGLVVSQASRGEAGGEMDGAPDRELAGMKFVANLCNSGQNLP
jgi:hypothetical protein